MTERPIRELVEELLTVDVEKARIDARRQALRAELEERARRVHREDGVVPTWKAAGLGVVTWCAAESEVSPVLVDDDAYADWAAAEHPDNVTLRLEVTLTALRANGYGDLPTFVRVLKGIPGTRIDYLVAPALFDALIAGGYRLADLGDGEFRLVGPDGSVVPGVGGKRRDPYLSVRLDRQAKARARAAGAGLDPSLAELEEATDD